MIQVGDIVHKKYGPSGCPLCGTKYNTTNGSYGCGYDGTFTHLNHVQITRMCKNFKQQEEQVKEVKSGTMSDTSVLTKKCSCDWNELLNYGCKCGGV